MKNKLFISFSGLVCIIFLYSCPSPLDPVNLSILQDLHAPVIIITSPSQDSEFKSSVTVSGKIIDIDDSGNERFTEAGTYIKAASYLIQNHDNKSKTIHIANNGRFNFSIETVQFTKQISILISAEDVNGNICSISLSLEPNTEGPLLLITSPSDYSEYATVIELSGFAVNSKSDSTTSELNTTISYNIPGTSIRGITELNTLDGSFSEIINVSTLDGNKTIEVTAMDFNSNETTLVLNVVKPAGGGDISGFTVTPDNKQVTISWDPVAYAESYSIFESSYGETIPSEAITDNSYTWAELENGEVYSFQLTAHVPEGLGNDAVSEYVTKMPGSMRTFAPWLKKIGYKSITIEWEDNENVERYIVERSLYPDGPYEVRRNLTAHSFKDDNVKHGVEYFYRITPADYEEITSLYLSATPGRFGDLMLAASYTLQSTVLDVDMSADNLYVANGSAGLKIVDVSNPLAPHQIGQCSTSNMAWGIEVINDYAFVADRASGFQLIDVSDPTEPFVAGSCDTPGYAWDVSQMANGAVLIADHNHGLQVIDPSSMSIVGNYNTPKQARGVTSSGNYAFVADGEGGLQIIDCNVMSNPYLTGSCSTSQYAWDVAIEGIYTYIADGWSGLQCIDTSNLANPQIIGNFDTSGAEAVRISGDYAYIADGNMGLVIIDISTPSTPTLIDSYNSAATSHGLVVDNNYIYLSEGENLTILDFPEPKNPIIVGNYNTPDRAFKVDVSGNLAFIADDESGIQVIDVSNPSSPTFIGNYNTSGYAYNICISENYAFISDAHDGLLILDISNPAALSKIGSCETLGMLMILLFLEIMHSLHTELRDFKL